MCTVTRRASGRSTARRAKGGCSACMRGAARRRRVCLELGRRSCERVLLRRRSVSRRQRPRRGHVRLHEQPTVRRDARIRRRAGMLRARGANGQARRCPRHLTGRATASQRDRARRHASDRAADHRLGARGRGDPPLCSARPARARGAAAGPYSSARWLGEHDPRRGRAPRCRLRGRDQEHRLLRRLRRLRHRPASVSSTGRQAGSPPRCCAPLPRSARA